MVSVICLCYNQVRFVKEALDSVVNQTYDEIELIIVDDGSTDGSQSAINNWIAEHDDVPFIHLKENEGSTRAFNRGLALASGKYVIDLATDDILLQNRVAEQVKYFEKLDDQVGVIYGDAQYVDESGHQLDRHFANKRLTASEGDVYEKLIDTYFIPTPTMMIRKKVLDELGGYDESLAYEDFDFWIRSARNWRYAYQPKVLTYVRKSRSSLSSGWYLKGDAQLHSTYLICEKIKKINKTKSENEALVRRLQFELRQSVFSGNHEEFNLFYQLLKELQKPRFAYRMLNVLNRRRLNLSPIRAFYHKLRFD